MLTNDFFTHCLDMIHVIQKEDLGKIDEAATMIADTVAQGHSFYIHDRGHLIGGELLARAGGPSFVRRLDFNAPDPLLTDAYSGSSAYQRDKLDEKIRKELSQDFMRHFIAHVLDMNGIGAGDLILLNSNSGYGFPATDIAAIAKDRGVKLIVMSSKATADAITPETGGKKLSEYADILFDNHAPYGDAVFDLEGVDEKVWPASGMGAVFIAWPMILKSIELLVKRGVSPTIYRSVNIPGGREQVEAAKEKYQKTGL